MSSANRERRAPALVRAGAPEASSVPRTAKHFRHALAPRFLRLTRAPIRNGGAILPGLEPRDSGVGDGRADGAIDAGPAPTEAALHVFWTIKGRTGNALTCAEVPNQYGVSTLITQLGDGGVGRDNVFNCTAGESVVLNLPFGQYALSPSIINSSGEILGEDSVEVLDLRAATGCDEIIAGDCVRRVNLVLKLL